MINRYLKRFHLITNFEQFHGVLKKIESGKLGPYKVITSSPIIEKMVERLTKLYEQSQIQLTQLKSSIHAIRKIIKDPRAAATSKKVEERLEALEFFINSQNGSPPADLNIQQWAEFLFFENVNDRNHINNRLQELQDQDVPNILPLIMPHLAKLPTADSRINVFHLLASCPKDLRTPGLTDLIIKYHDRGPVNLNQMAEPERNKTFIDWLDRIKKVNIILQGLPESADLERTVDFHLLHTSAKERGEIIPLVEEVLDRFLTGDDRVMLLLTLILTAPQKRREVVDIIKGKVDPNDGLLPRLFTDYTEIRDASFRHYNRVLHNVSYKLSVEEVRGLAILINSNTERLGIDETNATAQLSSWIELVTGPDYSEDPYAFHEQLLEELNNEDMVDINSQINFVSEIPVSWNFEAIRAKAQRQQLTFADLPPDVSPHSLLQTFNSMENRLRARALLLEWQKNILDTVKNLITDEIKALEKSLTRQETEEELRLLKKAQNDLQNVLEAKNKVETPLDWLKTCRSLRSELLSQPLTEELINAKGESDDPIENTLLYFYAILKAMHDRSDERGAEVLSPREEFLLGVLCSVNVCDIGQRDGYAICYESLPGQYHNSKLMQSQTTAQTILEKFVDSAYQIESNATFANTSYLQEMTGEKGKVSQESHQTQYLLNRWGSQVGNVRKVTFDLHCHAIYRTLPQREPTTAVSVYDRHLSRKKAVERLQKNINEEFVANQNAKEQAKAAGDEFVDNGINFNNLMEVMEPAIPIEKKDGWQYRCFEFDKSFSPQGITEEGAAMLFAAFNYLTIETNLLALQPEHRAQEIIDAIASIPKDQRSSETIQAILNLFDRTSAEEKRAILQELAAILDERKSQVLDQTRQFLLNWPQNATPNGYFRACIINLFTSNPGNKEFKELVRDAVTMFLNRATDLEEIPISKTGQASFINTLAHMPLEDLASLLNILRSFKQRSYTYDTLYRKPLANCPDLQRVGILAACSQILAKDAPAVLYAFVMERASSIIQTIPEPDRTQQVIENIIKILAFPVSEISQKDRVSSKVEHQLKTIEAIIAKFPVDFRARMINQFIDQFPVFDLNKYRYLFAAYNLIPNKQASQFLLENLAMVVLNTHRHLFAAYNLIPKKRAFQPLLENLAMLIVDIYRYLFVAYNPEKQASQSLLENLAMLVKIAPEINDQGELIEIIKNASPAELENTVSSLITIIANAGETDRASILQLACSLSAEERVELMTLVDKFPSSQIYSGASSLEVIMLLPKKHRTPYLFRAVANIYGNPDLWLLVHYIIEDRIRQLPKDLRAGMIRRFVNQFPSLDEDKRGYLFAAYSSIPKERASQSLIENIAMLMNVYKGFSGKDLIKVIQDTKPADLENTVSSLVTIVENTGETDREPVLQAACSLSAEERAELTALADKFPISQIHPASVSFRTILLLPEKQRLPRLFRAIANIYSLDNSWRSWYWNSRIKSQNAIIESRIKELPKNLRAGMICRFVDQFPSFDENKKGYLFAAYSSIPKEWVSQSLIENIAMLVNIYQKDQDQKDLITAIQNTDPAELENTVSSLVTLVENTGEPDRESILRLACSLSDEERVELMALVDKFPISQIHPAPLSFRTILLLPKKQQTPHLFRAIANIYSFDNPEHIWSSEIDSQNSIIENRIKALPKDLRAGMIRRFVNQFPSFDDDKKGYLFAAYSSIPKEWASLSLIENIAMLVNVYQEEQDQKDLIKVIQNTEPAELEDTVSSLVTLQSYLFFN